MALAWSLLDALVTALLPSKGVFIDLFLEDSLSHFFDLDRSLLYLLGCEFYFLREFLLFFPELYDFSGQLLQSWYALGVLAFLKPRFEFWLYRDWKEWENKFLTVLYAICSAYKNNLIDCDEWTADIKEFTALKGFLYVAFRRFAVVSYSWHCLDCVVFLVFYNLHTNVFWEFRELFWYGFLFATHVANLRFSSKVFCAFAFIFPFAHFSLQ